MSDALTVDLMRGHAGRQIVESTHGVVAVVVDAEGSVVEAWGDPDRVVFPRSSVKLVQALPLVETGAADVFGMGDRELALACGSHNGETGHIEAVTGWLARIGCTTDDLECGIQCSPRDGGDPGNPVTNNCSGKHAGFLTVARHLGVETAGYIEADHPVQKLVTAALADLCGVAIDPADAAVDGCGIPVHPVPLHALARSAARVAAPPADRSEGRTDGIQRLSQAAVAAAWYVGGTGRLVTDILDAAAGSIIVKDGAEGVQWAALPEAGLGVAIKCIDGSARAAGAALGHVLDRLGVTAASSVFENYRRVTNWAGTHVADLVVHG